MLSSAFDGGTSVINRGNYRQRIFAGKGAAEAFERTLGEATERFVCLPRYATNIQLNPVPFPVDSNLSVFSMKKKMQIDFSLLPCTGESRAWNANLIWSPEETGVNTYWQLRQTFQCDNLPVKATLFTTRFS